MFVGNQNDTKKLLKPNVEYIEFAMCANNIVNEITNVY